MKARRSTPALSGINCARSRAKQDYLVMFKNETHNHPTEIEPFGGAATCLGRGDSGSALGQKLCLSRHARDGQQRSPRKYGGDNGPISCPSVKSPERQRRDTLPMEIRLAWRLDWCMKFIIPAIRRNAWRLAPWWRRLQRRMCAERGRKREMSSF